MSPSKRNVSQILVIVNSVAKQTSTGITHQTNAELPVWFSGLVILWCAVILSEDGIPRHAIATMCTCRYYHAAVVRMMSFTHATGWPAFTPWTLATQRYSASISGSLYVCNISLFRFSVPCRLKGQRIFPNSQFPNVFPIRTCSPTILLFFLDFFRLSPQGSDLPKPFPESILAHTATVLSYNMALIITSIKPINPSYFIIVDRLSLFHWFICVSLRFCHCISFWLMYRSIQLQSCKSV